VFLNNSDNTKGEEYKDVEGFLIVNYMSRFGLNK